MIVTTAQLFKLAYGKYAVGAYNINNMEQALGLFEGCLLSQAPFIIQLSKGSRKYAGSKMIEAIIRAAEERYPEAVFAVHLDHGDEATCYDCIDSGFYSSIMIDASHEVFDENVAITKRVVERAHAKGLSVEAELGMLGGVEEDIQIDEKHAALTDPDDAEKFVELSGCDCLAVAIGTSHGAYKFTRKPTGDILAIERIKEIHRRLPNTHLVMHGSSSVPQDLLAIIRQHGGNMKETYGVPVEEIQKAIQFGVRKINIDTDVRLAMTGAVRKYMVENPEKFDPRDWLKPAREAAKQICRQRYTEFGCEGQGSKIKGNSLKYVAGQYARGELAQVVQ